ncbi:T6SS immunity protein Tdi1 domain-containing protein [Horticoccus sp. 23ND18S-11]|uniref:T6SS immunity protein Tdi1 domain-containing protein n=1 Tax=Horticoccus sp. 23ND18S-11 TaxID=3391832 RepID=UPI0039C92B7F
MNLHDYIIDHSSFDWQKLVANWHWRLPPQFTTWLVNRFGDLFLKTDDGKIHVLRLDDGSLRCLAASRDQFCDLLDQGNNANDWLMIPLVDRLVAAGKTLRQGECYAFVQIPILGGDYVVENIVVRTAEFQFAALGLMFEQLEDVPDGTNVTFRIGNKKSG